LTAYNKSDIGDASDMTYGLLLSSLMSLRSALSWRLRRWKSANRRLCKLSLSTMGACMHACMHLSMHMYVCMYTCMYVCMHACMRACMHACTHTYVSHIFNRSASGALKGWCAGATHVIAPAGATHVIVARTHRTAHMQHAG